MALFANVLCFQLYEIITVRDKPSTHVKAQAPCYVIAAESGMTINSASNVSDLI